MIINCNNSKCGNLAAIEKKSDWQVGKNPFKMITIALIFLMLMSATLPGLTRSQTAVVEESAYTAHDPIRINGNADFAAQAAAEGWPGDGSEGNPYVIEGYEINGTSHELGILINNTNLHFELRGNYVHGSKYGISFMIVQNAIIEDNRLSNNNYSIKLAHSNRNIITNNTISDNVWVGIYLIMSSNNTVFRNNVSNQKYGIAIGYSDENIIANNTISNSSKVGIVVTVDGIYTHNHDIRDNIYINNTYDYDLSITVENGGNRDEIPATYLGLILIFAAIFTATLVIWKRKKNRKEGE